MISIPDSLPLIRHAQGLVSPLDHVWLRHYLARAAAKAGYEQWWLATDVARSVTSYLEENFKDPVLSWDGLSATVRAVLQVIGYSEVALHFEMQTPPTRVCLDEIALRAGSGYELAFFPLLGRELQVLIAAGARALVLENLACCVKHLRGAKCWREDCRTLQNEIVEFVRHQTFASPTAGELTISLS